ncbi:SGNH hydrolase domain-containing protein [Micromonospora sonneratiae]|uniref:Acyltransferase family protein n=1 Tax=Micromonospora sonneratiae TaxID=1184706 RepID=A0ABW3YF02_9ACTN
MAIRTDTRPDVGGSTAFRGDIEGMRALAVILVLLTHAGIAFMPGGFIGVDVFFVISGFLITRLLVAELASTGRISLVGFYARRAKRLLPAAGVVLAVTLLLTYFYLPRTRWSDTGWDVVASGLYAMNWRLAEQAVDYLAADQAPSILQHYWSLAVEEQFYLIWPVLLAVAGIWAVRSRSRGRTDRFRLLLGVPLAVLAIASLAWSIHLTQTNPGQAYFVTTTRVWELALGGLLALLGPRLVRLPRSVAVVLGWVGLTTVVGVALFLEPTAPFPGQLALLPTLGTVAMIAGGPAAGRAGPGCLLGLRPVRAIGAISYSLYLWHWPLFVVAEAQLGELAPAARLGVMLFSVLPAVLTYRYVENPIRRAETFTWDPAQAIRLGLSFTMVPALAGVLFQFTVWPPNRSPLPVAQVPWVEDTASAPPSPSGAAVLGDHPRDSRAGTPVDRVGRITPDPVDAGDDLPDVYRHDCIAEGSDARVRSCVYGDREADFTVALAGDSHAASWLPALQAVAVANRWRLVTYIKAACPLIHGEIAWQGRAQPSCTEWNTELRSLLTGSKRPDLLVTSSFLYSPIRDEKQLSGSEGQSAMANGLRRSWSVLVETGVPVVVLRDTPHMNVDVPECVAKHPERLTKCSAPRSLALRAGGGVAQEEAADGLKGVHLVDLNDAICPGDRCAAVIGGVLVYRDTNHLTASYASSLAPRLRAALNDVVGDVARG